MSPDAHMLRLAPWDVYRLLTLLSYLVDLGDNFAMGILLFGKVVDGGLDFFDVLLLVFEPMDLVHQVDVDLVKVMELGPGKKIVNLKDHEGMHRL